MPTPRSAQSMGTDLRQWRLKSKLKVEGYGGNATVHSVKHLNIEYLSKALRASKIQPDEFKSVLTPLQQPQSVLHTPIPRGLHPSPVKRLKSKSKTDTAVARQGTA